MGRAGGLDLECELLLRVEEGGEKPLVASGFEHVRGEIAAAAGGDEEEDVMGGRAEGMGQFGDAEDLIFILLSDGRVDLEREARFQAGVDSS